MVFMSLRRFLPLWAVWAGIFASVCAPAEGLVNTTKEPMICDIRIPALYAREKIHGILQNVKTREAEKRVKVLRPGEEISLEPKGRVVCFNRLLKLDAYGTRVNRIEGERLKPFLNRQRLLDIAGYVNEDKAYVKSMAGRSLQCRPYRGGEYCNVLSGLDLLFGPRGRVKRLFLYDTSVSKLPFGAEALEKLRPGGTLPGLWIRERNRRLFASGPALEAESVRIWNKPAPQIASVIMTAKEGHPILRRYGKDQNVSRLFQALEVVYILDDKAYRKHKEKSGEGGSGGSVPYRARRTWGTTLNPGGAIPQNGFKAFYIDTNHPKKIVASERVREIAINYSWDKFHGIKSQNFGAYWVGEIAVPRETEKSVSVSMSWAKARIIIDGIVVFEGGRGHTFTHRFTPGKHRIEAEYVNNWHTTDFKVTFSDPVSYLDAASLRKKLASVASGAKALYVGVYESRNKGKNIPLRLKKSATPVVLVLNSYDSVDWELSPEDAARIRAVVVASAKPGSTVKGFGDRKRIFYLRRPLGSYTMERKCSCINGGADFHCEGSFGDETLATVERITGLPVYGYSTTYGARNLAVPLHRYDEAAKKSFARNREEVKKREKECRRQMNPSFESMFKSPQ
jgi:hypothetical protein